MGLPDRLHKSASADEGVALSISRAFMRGELDFTRRAGAPTPGWAAMPECVAAEAIHKLGGDDVAVRRFVTFTAAMDRARDADRLWAAAARLYETAAWVFDPPSVAAGSLLDLADALRPAGVSQRHGADAAAWRLIGESFADRERAPAVHDAVFAGVGDARELLAALQQTTAARTDLFPFLRGPKVGRADVGADACCSWQRLHCLDGRRPGRGRRAGAPRHGESRRHRHRGVEAR